MFKTITKIKNEETPFTTISSSIKEGISRARAKHNDAIESIVVTMDGVVKFEGNQTDGNEYFDLSEHRKLSTAEDFVAAYIFMEGEINTSVALSKLSKMTKKKRERAFRRSLAKYQEVVHG